MVKLIRVPSDVVFYMFSFLEAGSRFNANLSYVYGFFAEVSRQKEFAELFKDFIFEEQYMCPPYSKQVNIALDGITKSGLLSMIDSGVYEVTEALTKKDSGELFSTKEIILLKKMAKIFTKEMGVFLPPWHKNYKKDRG